MDIFRFKEWNVYKEAKQLFEIIINMVNNLPKEYKYSIGDQAIRAGLSRILNIAEGSGKNSDKELNRFFNIAIGSVNETFAVVDIMKDLNFITEKELEKVSKLCVSVSKQLGGFKKTLRSL